VDPVSKAQAGNSQDSRGDRVKAYRWPKGKSGNPEGRPKKLQITKMYERILSSPANRKAIEKSVLQVLTSGRMATVLMAREMAERTEGKVEQVVDMNLSGTLVLAEIIAERRKKRGGGSDS
jgi:hypothetical protein